MLQMVAGKGGNQSHSTPWVTARLLVSKYVFWLIGTVFILTYPKLCRHTCYFYTRERRLSESILRQICHAIAFDVQSHTPSIQQGRMVWMIRKPDHMGGGRLLLSRKVWNDDRRLLRSFGNFHHNQNTVAVFMCKQLVSHFNSICAGWLRNGPPPEALGTYVCGNIQIKSWNDWAQH